MKRLKPLLHRAVTTKVFFLLNNDKSLQIYLSKEKCKPKNDFIKYVESRVIDSKNLFGPFIWVLKTLVQRTELTEPKSRKCTL